MKRNTKFVCCGGQFDTKGAKRMLSVRDYQQQSSKLYWYDIWASKNYLLSIIT